MATKEADREATTTFRLLGGGMKLTKRNSIAPQIPACASMGETCEGDAILVGTYHYGSEDGPQQFTMAACEPCDLEERKDKISGNGETFMYFHNVQVWVSFE